MRKRSLSQFSDHLSTKTPPRRRAKGGSCALFGDLGEIERRNACFVASENTFEFLGETEDGHAVHVGIGPFEGDQLSHLRHAIQSAVGADDVSNAVLFRDGVGLNRGSEQIGDSNLLEAVFIYRELNDAFPKEDVEFFDGEARHVRLLFGAQERNVVGGRSLDGEGDDFEFGVAAGVEVFDEIVEVHGVTCCERLFEFLAADRPPFSNKTLYHRNSLLSTKKGDIMYYV